eukprot:TRINITY_DN13422_c0_g1_i1.p1 TRINITY_DN13422_c0_g1~~TRINITY_DN13422_c0_g1_i1.p1  ORF type:complete len:168 (+),score=12.39 TRINITY_DN13422_c0_g1_i1:115-618(+)
MGCGASAKKYSEDEGSTSTLTDIADDASTQPPKSGSALRPMPPKPGPKPLQPAGKPGTLQTDAGSRYLESANQPELTHIVSQDARAGSHGDGLTDTAVAAANVSMQELLHKYQQADRGRPRSAGRDRHRIFAAETSEILSSSRPLMVDDGADLGVTRLGSLRVAPVR